MSTVLSFENIKTKTKNFNIYITIGTGIVDVTYTPHLITLGTFKIGSIHEDEMLLFPGSFSMTFTFVPAVTGGNTPSISAVRAAYKDILEKIQTQSTKVEVYDTGTMFFTAKLKNDIIDGDEFSAQLKLTFLDDLAELNDPLPLYRHPSDGQYYFWPDGETLNTKKTLMQFINEILPDITINFVSDFRFKYQIDPSTVGYCYLYEIGCKNINIYNNISFPQLETRGDVLKLILNNFASYAVLGFNRVLYILPRYYPGSPVINIDRPNIKGSRLPFKTIKTLRGLIIKIAYGKYFDDASYWYEQPQYQIDGYPETRVANIAVDQIEKQGYKLLYLPFGVGGKDVNEFGYSRSLYKMPGGERILSNSAAYKKEDGTYSIESSLSYWAGSNIWQVIKSMKRHKQTELIGTDYTFTDFFMLFNDPSKIYRTIFLEYDYNSDSTKLTITECVTHDGTPASEKIIFTKILQALDAYLTINGNIITDNITDIVVNPGTVIKFMIKNPYASNAAAATEYNGNVINIPIDQRDVWGSIAYQEIYMFVSTNNLDPQFSYPNENDANGRWYIIAEIADLKNTDPNYYYEYNFGGIYNTTKIQFWCGHRSKDAPQFNVPYYFAIQPQPADIITL